MTSEHDRVQRSALPIPDYRAQDSPFKGIVHWVQLDIGKDNFNHLITPEERLRVVMTRP